MVLKDASDNLTHYSAPQKNKAPFCGLTGKGLTFVREKANDKVILKQDFICVETKLCKVYFIFPHSVISNRKTDGQMGRWQNV